MIEKIAFDNAPPGAFYYEYTPPNPVVSYAIAMPPLRLYLWTDTAGNVFSGPFARTADIVNRVLYGTGYSGPGDWYECGIVLAQGDRHQFFVFVLGEDDEMEWAPR